MNGRELRRARPLLGTLVDIRVFDANDGATRAIDAAFAEIERIHRLMSFHETDSDVTRINRSAAMTSIEVDSRTHEVLNAASELSGCSRGVFDVTVGAALLKAGFLPGRDGLSGYSADADYRDIVLLDDNRLTLRRRVCIDLGGIAKGYAVDRAVLTLQQLGVHAGVVNAGGDLRVFGDPQPVYMRHPQNTRPPFPLGMIADMAVASSSGCYSEQQLGERMVDPLVDTRRGHCTRWRHGVTVLAPSCMMADALTKIVRLSPRRAVRVLERFQACAAVAGTRGIRRLGMQPGERSFSYTAERRASQ